MKNIKGRALGNVFVTLFIILSACGVAILSSGERGMEQGALDVPGAVDRFELPTVVIDAGHGGADCGAVGVNGALEKDINLKLSLMIADEFENAGYKVILTRSEDVMLVDTKNEHTTKKSSDLTARTQIAEEGQLFLSIHMNKFPEEKYSGAQVYYSVNDARSERLAELIQLGIIAALQPENNRVIKSGNGLYLLDRVKCPAVILECGFLSNREEAEKLNDEAYLKQLGFEIFSAADDFVIECMDNAT